MYTIYNIHAVMIMLYDMILLRKSQISLNGPNPLQDYVSDMKCDGLGSASRTRPHVLPHHTQARPQRKGGMPYRDPGDPLTARSTRTTGSW